MELMIRALPGNDQGRRAALAAGSQPDPEVGADKSVAALVCYTVDIAQTAFDDAEKHRAAAAAANTARVAAHAERDEAGAKLAAAKKERDEAGKALAAERDEARAKLAAAQKERDEAGKALAAAQAELYAVSQQLETARAKATNTASANDLAAEIDAMRGALLSMAQGVSAVAINATSGGAAAAAPHAPETLRYVIEGVQKDINGLILPKLGLAKSAATQGAELRDTLAFVAACFGLITAHKAGPQNGDHNSGMLIYSRLRAAQIAPATAEAVLQAVRRAATTNELARGIVLAVDPKGGAAFERGKGRAIIPAKTAPQPQCEHQDGDASARGGQAVGAGGGGVGHSQRGRRHPRSAHRRGRYGPRRLLRGQRRHPCQPGGAVRRARRALRVQGRFRRAAAAHDRGGRRSPHDARQKPEHSARLVRRQRRVRARAP